MTIETREGDPFPEPPVFARVSNNMAVGVYHTHDGAEAAVKALDQSGFDMRKLSIVGKDYHTEEHVVGYYNTGDRVMAWGKSGAFWGAMWGLLFGSAFFMIPGVGPVLMAGPLVAALVSMMEGAVVVGGLSALGGALVSIGLPENDAVRYKTQIAAGKFLLLVSGTSDDITRAEGLLILSGH